MKETEKINLGDAAVTLGWILVLVIPLIIFYELHHFQVIWTINYFLSFFAATLIMWMFRLVPYLVPAILLIACCLLLNIVPQQVILSGFVSKSFFLVLSFSFLGAIILKSNLLMRPTLWALSKMPPSLFLLELFLYIVGFFTSAIINVQTNRFDITVPLYRIIIGEANLAKNLFARSCLSIACYAGTIYFSELFLTGKSTNLPVMELLPRQTQMQFSWSKWLVAASVPVLLMQIPLIITFFVLFHRQVDFAWDKPDLIKKRKNLGRISFSEIIALCSIGLLMIGIILSSFHIVDLAWFCFTLLFLLLLFPILSKEEFRSYINWAFLLYLGAIIGIVQSMHYLHLDTKIADLFPSLYLFAGQNIYYCIITLFLVSMLCTALVGSVASVILLVPLCLPLASVLIISPWIIGFIILVACESWFLSYQSTYQLYFEELTEKDTVFDKTKILQMNIVFILYRFFALIGSVFYWRYLGLL